MTTASFSYSDAEAAAAAVVVVFGSVAAESIVIDEGDFIVVVDIQ